MLRNNNGGEFCGKEFDQLCKQCGISRQNTTPYTPQQNGVVKRMNKTLVDKARSMLSGVGLTNELWAVVVKKTRYMVNKVG